MNNLKYLIVDVPVNSLKSAGIVAGATIWSGALLTIALPTTAGLVSVVVGASLTSYIIRASYSIISTGTFATIYLLDTDVKDIYKMVKRRFSKAQCSSLF